MGLTIHYTLQAPPTATRDALTAHLESAREFAKLLPFESVSEIDHFSEDDFTDAEEDDWHWAKIQASIYHSFDDEHYHSIEPLEATIFRVVVGAGCEHANFGFARYPESVVLEGKTVQTEIDGWQRSSFCKTQYANQYGVNHFYRCHLSIAAMLDYFKSLGVVKSVTDEGGYYDQRDLNVLRAELEKYDALIAAMAGSLMDNFDSVEAPILSRPDFEHLEMKGLELNPHLEELVKLIQQIKATTHPRG